MEMEIIRAPVAMMKVFKKVLLYHGKSSCG
jgi:hypothetical protein